MDTHSVVDTSEVIDLPRMRSGDIHHHRCEQTTALVEHHAVHCSIGAVAAKHLDHLAVEAELGARSTRSEGDVPRRKHRVVDVAGRWFEGGREFAVGVVGEIVAPMIVSNSVINVLDGYISDDTLRDYGIVNPQQFAIGKA